MTLQEYHHLGPQKLHEFRFYHGRIVAGLLKYHPDIGRDVFYLIETFNLGSWRQAKTREEKMKFMERVNIATINFWQPIDI